MKKRITFFHVLKLFLLSAAIFLTTSCENFLNNGQSVKNEIEDAIAYNNATAGNLHFWAEIEKGSFLTGNEKNCKLGYSVEVQFVVKTASYKYDGMEAVDNKDQKTSLADCVEFEDITSDTEKENGIYRVKVKLLKQRDDILIRPICKLIPRVSEVTPKNESNGCDQDSVIKIVFNKPMNIQSFGNFECLSISSEGASVAEYFASPYFLDDKKTLCIEPLGVTDQTKLLLVPNGNIENKNISVELAFTGQELCEDGLALTQNIQHRYKINRKYRNFKKATVKMKPKNEMGEFTSGSSIEAIVGYSSELEFQLSKAYYFVGLHAVSQKNENTSLDSIVLFSTIQDGNKDSNGICKIKMIVNEKNDDILIVPECIKYPAVENLEPQFSTDGVNTNNPIVIHFNMPMEDAEVQAKDSLFKSPNISLVYTDSAKTNYDMSEYFEAPKFDQEKRTLTFIPKPVSLRSFIADLQHRSYIDIKLAFDEKITVTQQGITLSILQDENSSYTLRYKPDVETGKPVKPDGALFFATKDSELTIEKAATFEESKKIPAGTFDDSHFTDSQTVLAHRVGSTIYIYGEYKDEGSGVRTVVVKEKLLNNKAGTDVSALHQFQTYQYDLYTDPTAQAQFDDSGTAKFCIAHQLHGDDGLMLLKVSVQDACQNESAETIVTVVHDEEFGMGKITPYNTTDPNYFTGAGGNAAFVFNKNTFEQDLNTLRLLSQTKQGYPNSSVVSKRIYKDIYLDSNDIHLKCNYEINSEIVEKDFEYDQNTQEWLCSLDIEKIDGLKFDIFITDDIGNVLKTTGQFPGMPYFICTNQYYKMVGSDYPFSFTKYVVNENNELIVSTTQVAGRLRQGISDCFVFFQNDYLFGPITDDIIPGTYNMEIDNELPPVVIKKIDLEKLEKNYQITVTIDDNSWENNKYDSIGIQYDNDTRRVTLYGMIQKGVFNYTFTVGTSELWNHPEKIDLFGLKNQKQSVLTSITYPEKPFKEEENAYSYDNESPAFNGSSNIMNDSYQFFCSYNVNPQYYDYVKLFSLADHASGIKSLEWTINGSDAVYSGGFVNTYTYVPVWDMDESSVVLNFTATDYNNNTSSFEKTVNFIEVPQFELRWKSTNTYELCAYSESDIWKIWRVGVYQLQEGGSWSLIPAASKNMQVLDNVEHLAKPTRDDNWYSFGDVTLPPDTYIKVVTEATSYPLPNTDNYGVSDAYYMYNGDLCSGEHDLFFMGVDAALIASDKPVYVETRATKRPYEECKLWTYEDWNRRTRKHLGEELFIFDDTDYSPRKYYIALDDRMTEYVAVGECYVVIAHFADGDEPQYSSVMIRER